MPEKTIKLESIRIDGGTQPRAGLNTNKVSEYAESMREGAKFPALKITFDGSDHWLVGGFHRYHAMRKNGEASAECVVTNGTQDDAVWASYAENIDHGLPRSNADKRYVAGMALRDRPQLSDRAIAGHIGVSHNFVGELRRGSEQKQVSSDDTSKQDRPQRRVGVDGKTYPVAPPRPVKPAPEPEAAPTNGKAPPKPEPKKAPPRPEQRKDGAGRLVNNPLVAAALDQVVRFTDLVSRAHALRRDIEALAAEPLGHQIRIQRVVQALNGEVADIIKFAAPYTTCPYVPNCTSADCKTCSGQCWVTQQQWKNLPPEVKGGK